MEIGFHDGVLSFDDVSIRYDKRCLSPAQVVDLLKEWVRRLVNKSTQQRPLRLPFSIDDEFIEVFEIEEKGDGLISLTIVKLDGIGYTPGVDSLMEAIVRERPVIERRSTALLVCNEYDLLEAIQEILTKMDDR